MSTYLVAVVVGDLDSLEGMTATGVRVRLFTPVGRRESAHFSLECTCGYCVSLLTVLVSLFVSL